MKLAYILTESDKDIEILQKLLPKKLTQDIQFIAGGVSASFSTIQIHSVSQRPWVIFSCLLFIPAKCQSARLIPHNQV
jgi:hypothetical protein